MRPSVPITLCLLLAPVPALRAQSPDLTNVRDSVGVFERDGAVHAVAWQYRARFHERGLEFTPYLGGDAPRSLPLDLRAESCGREGGAGPLAARDGRPSIDGETVVLDHGAFVQTCEVRPDGIKQSFVFHALPSGPGDLFVRLRSASVVDAESTADGGVRFVDADFGGVTVGAVVGIDAAGARCDGALRVSQGSLEFRLPAAFVDGAALPLTVDPLIGSQIRHSTGGSLGAQNPSVAYRAVEDVYCVVFLRSASWRDGDVLAQRLTGGGRSAGALLAVEVGSGWTSFDASVASIRDRGAFVVAFGSRTSVHEYVRGAAVSAATNAVGSAVTLHMSQRGLLGVVGIGGNTAPSSRYRAVVVFDDYANVSVYALGVDVGNGLQLSASAPRFLDYGLRPAIANNGGTFGSYLVVWQTDFETSGTDVDLEGMVLSHDLLPRTPITTLVTTRGRQFARPAVDGDGETWVTAYNRRLSSGGTWSTQAVSTTWRPGMAAPASRPAQWIKVTDPVRDALRPSVAWMGSGTCLVAYSLEAAGGQSSEAFVKSVDLLDCMTCEPEVRLASTSRSLVTAVASEYSGGGASEEALVVRSEFEVADQLYVRKWRSEDGLVTSLGGGCGAGSGRIWANCARVGHAAFELRLTGASPSAATWMVLGLDRLDFPCGNCRLVPDPFQGFVFSSATNAAGDAAVSLPIPGGTPSARGLSFYAQWLVPPRGGAPCSAIPFGMSDAIRVQIQ